MAKVNDEILKRTVIAGAAAALKFRREKPLETDQKILRKVAENLKSIIKEIDKD